MIKPKENSPSLPNEFQKAIDLAGNNDVTVNLKSTLMDVSMTGTLKTSNTNINRRISLKFENENAAMDCSIICVQSVNAAQKTINMVLPD